MVYLDYAAHTPACEEVSTHFITTLNQFFANPNSNYPPGIEALQQINSSTYQIQALLNVPDHEVIYTSGATESNNLAIQGVAGAYRRYGNHIITTYLEHSSVTGAITALKNQGYDIDYVDIDEHGQVDREHLQELIREDTILVSICYVDSEVGLQQPIEEISKLLSSYSHCVFHVDATQAIGKIPVTFEQIDLITFSPHKFFGMNSSGVLLKKQGILLEPIIHGGISITKSRSGTPDVAMAAAIEKALIIALKDVETSYKKISHLNQYLREALQRYATVTINSTSKSIPHILNISMKGVKTELIQQELAKESIYVSTKSACCAINMPSRPVYAITKDRKLALSTLRISMSDQTTLEEIDLFLSTLYQILEKQYGY